MTSIANAAPDYLTIADLVAMPRLGLQLVAGEAGAGNGVVWTHTSELEDPGPWLEGGELLIVNGFGVPATAEGQVTYVARLAQHRLAGLVVSVKAPELTQELLDEADRLEFPVLKIPRRVPFIELSYLVANASDRSANGRLARHLKIFETLRYRNSTGSSVREIYSQLERVSGYRLALVSPAGTPLLRSWSWVPDDLELRPTERPRDLQLIPQGYVLPLVVGQRVTAYLVGKEHPDAEPGGLAALQHVATLAALDAIDDQRRREALHREGSALLSRALDHDGASDDLIAGFVGVGLGQQHGLRFLALDGLAQKPIDEIEVRDWLADRSLPHLLLNQDSLSAVVNCEESDLRSLAADLDIQIGVSVRTREFQELARMRRQAQWSLSLARESPEAAVVFAEDQLGLAQWLNPDVETMRHLATSALAPIIQHDSEKGTELVETLSVYFQHQGRLRATSAQLFIHEHTLGHRIKKIQQLTGRDLRVYRDAFELWLAIESKFLVQDE